jgi:hypothetical protein
MAWEWSHTDEAYYNAFENLSNQSREFLEVAMAEWLATDEDGFDTEKYDRRALPYAKRMDDDTLINSIWERAGEQRTCDNGGFNAWVCPYGCHQVSFDCEQVED